MAQPAFERDDVWLVDFGTPFPGEPAHRRPAVVVGPTAEWRGLPFAVVVPVTSTFRDLPEMHVEIEPSSGAGLDVVSFAQCELVRSVSMRRLVTRLGRVDVVASWSIEQTVRDILGY